MVDNVIFAKNLFSEIENALFFGDKLDEGEMPVLMQPGLFIGNLRESDDDDLATQSELLDECLAASFLYDPTPFTLSRLYQDILEFSALPKKTLTSAEEAEISDLLQWLGDNRALYDLYMGRYEEADTLYQAEVNSQDPDNALIGRLRRKRTQARRDWQTFGKKRDYESRQARVIYLYRGDPVSHFQNLQDEVDSAKLFDSTGAEFLPTYLQPSVSEWLAAGTSWGEYDKTVAESDTYDYSKSTSWSGRVKAGWGLFSGSAGASGSKVFTHHNTTTSAVNVKFEYLRVRLLRRTWFDRNVFGYRFWTWKDTTGYRTISDGGNLMINPPVAPLGECPVVPTNLIVARNVRLSANWSMEDRTYLEENLTTSASAGWGPFSVSGSYTEQKIEKKVSARFDGVEISIDQPQIIGYTGELFKSPVPNPDPTLPWEDDAILPSEADYARLLAMKSQKASRQG